MKKLILSLGLMVAVAFAADAYLFGTGWGLDSLLQNKSDYVWEYVYFDTMTFHAKNGDSTINLGSPAYNFSMRSLNGAGDSGSVKVAFDSHKGFWHNDSIARNLGWNAVGLNTADDYFHAPVCASHIYVRPVVGGTADSTCTFELKFLR